MKFYTLRQLLGIADPPRHDAEVYRTTEELLRVLSGKDVPEEIPMEGMLSPGEAASRLGVSKVTLRRMVREGRVAAPVKPKGGKQVYFRSADVEAARVS